MVEALTFTFSPQLTAIVLAFMAMGLVYAIWFRSQRGALGFVWLVWFVLGMGFSQLPGMEAARDFSPLVRALAPWNLLLLALLPTTSPRSPGGLAIIGFWVLQLLAAAIMPEEKWLDLPDINIWLHSQLPGMVGEYTPPFEQCLPIAAAVVFFIRWQLNSRPNELAMLFVACLLLIGLMKPELLVTMLVGSGILLFLSVLYSSHRMAFLDALTGIQNRRSMDAAMGHLGGRYAIAMLDIDHFKKVNDRFGHDFGDQVLKMVAARVRQAGRFKFYRYGGEEFCLLFKGRRAALAEEICETVRLAVNERPIAMRSTDRPEQKPSKKKRSREKVPSVKVSVSIGLARPSEKYTTPDAVREAADKALYRAKKNGRNRVERAR
jgi:diguanylate cyclase (GGDEF)-like protein